MIFRVQENALANDRQDSKSLLNYMLRALNQFC